MCSVRCTSISDLHWLSCYMATDCDLHVTVHRVKFLILKPTICTNFSNLFLEWNSTCFGQFLCPSSGVFHCTHSNGICHTGHALISQIYSWNETLHVSDSSSVHHQEFFTVHTAMVYVIQVCWQLVSSFKMEQVPSWNCPLAVSKPVWHLTLLCVQWKITDDGQRNCPKHVEFHSKNRFEKLVHIVGFIVRKVDTDFLFPAEWVQL